MTSSSMPDPLLAKSEKQGRPLTLKDHLIDTENAALQIFRLDGRWGENWCRFFKLNSSELREKFLLNLRIAALFHDIGKANEDFYRAVKQPGNYPQTLRHEHISALILCLPQVRKWLAENPLLDADIITGAVLSHHLKAIDSGESYKDKGWIWCHPRTTQNNVTLYLQHPEVLSIIDRVSQLANLSTSLSLSIASWSPSQKWFQDGLKNGRAFARQFSRKVRRDSGLLSLLLAVKAGLIAADSVSSGMFRNNLNMTQWIDGVVHSKSIISDDVANAILNPRLQIIAQRGGTLRPFQRQMATQGPRVLLIAACAAGKTIAAWKWAEAQTDTHKIGRIIFLYPTRGTATEGFRDYVSWAPEGESALVHGTARYELEAMQGNPDDSNKSNKYDQFIEDHARLFALGLWSRRYFSATVDQFLSFMEHNYASMCLLPSLADSAVIIDEVHSFDKRMFDRLISFLKNFDMPVLCMTATLPPDRRKQLQDAGLQLYEANDDTELADLENHPRYRLETVSNSEDAIKIAVNSYKNGDKVLWVVNRVSECQRIAMTLEKALGIKVLTYHSRFKLEDRKNVHGKTVAAFQQDKLSAIAITTQVCEMSLDLDADVLITELAPISSLIQRFGRSNRHLKKGKEFRARVIVYSPEKHLPYTKEEIEAARTFITSYEMRDVSQSQLAEGLELYAITEPPPGDYASFLRGGYYAIPGEIRDIDDFSQSCILTTDLEKVKACLDNKEPIDGYIVNVPCKYAIKRDSPLTPNWLPKYLRLADGNQYDPDHGFLME